HPLPLKRLILSLSSRSSLQISPPFAVAEALEQAAETSASPRDASSSKVDKSGRFCSPRAARELALSRGSISSSKAGLQQICFAPDEEYTGSCC
ncbi:hypothetical protein GW17_00029268, partial [Ensete ventricosum]